MHDLGLQAQALRIAAQAFDIARRGTGRTTRMLEDVEDGHLVICSRREIGHMRHELRRRGIRAEVKVMLAQDFLDQRDNVLRGQRYTHFTHEFVQELVEQDIYDSLHRLAGKLNAVNEKQNKARAQAFKDEMMAPNPILESLPFVKAEGVKSGRFVHEKPNFHERPKGVTDEELFSGHGYEDGKPYDINGWQ